MKQARSEARKIAKAKRLEKAIALQMALEDRRASWALLKELAELDRTTIRWTARFTVPVRPHAPDDRTSSIVKRANIGALMKSGTAKAGSRDASSWVVDDHGMRGVIWQQSYLGRKSPDFYRGAAKDNWEYDVRDEAVMLDASGVPIIISNMGDDWIEIGVAWQAIEDASTRKNAKIQIGAIAPFDADMSDEEMIAALRHFCKNVLEPLGLPYSATMHKPPEGGNNRNVHPHLRFGLRPFRRLEPYLFEIADEVRGELDGRDGVQMLRHLWAHSMSEAAEQARSNRAYTGLSYSARGLPLEAGEHLGEARTAMVRRGTTVLAHERNRIKNARNAERMKIRDIERKIAALTAIRDSVIADQEKVPVPRARRLVAAVRPPIREREPLVSAGGPSRTPSIFSSKDTRSKRLKSAGTRLPLSAPLTIATTTNASTTAVAAERAMFARKSVPPLLTRSFIEPTPPSRLMASRSSSSPQKLTSASVATTKPKPLLKAAATRDARSPSVFLNLSGPPLAIPAAGDLKTRYLVAAIARAPASPIDRADQMTIAPLTALTLARAAADEVPAIRLSVRGQPASQLPPLIQSEQAVQTQAVPDWYAAHRRLLAIVEARKKAADAKKAAAKERAQVDAVAKSKVAPSGPEIISEEKNQITRQSTAADHALNDEPQPSAVAPAPGAERSHLAKPSHAAGQRPSRTFRWGADDDTMPRIDEIPTRTWFENNPQRAFVFRREEPLTAPPDARTQLLRAKDPYVEDLADGTFGLSATVLTAIGADRHWMAKPDVQAALLSLRTDQQRVMAKLRAEASRRPLEFERSGSKPWPRDLGPKVLARADRWSIDPGFENEFFSIHQSIEQAHQLRSRMDQQQRATHQGPAARATFESIPDGFGGMRDDPAPAFQPTAEAHIVLRAHDDTGKPTRQLLTLITFVAAHARCVQGDGGSMVCRNGDLSAQRRAAVRSPADATRRARSAERSGLGDHHAPRGELARHLISCGSFPAFNHRGEVPCAFNRAGTMAHVRRQASWPMTSKRLPPRSKMGSRLGRPTNRSRSDLPKRGNRAASGSSTSTRLRSPRGSRARRR